MTITDIASIVSMMGVIAAIVISVLKSRPEIRQTQAGSENTEADTAAKYQDIADRAAQRALKLETRIEEMETQILNMKLAKAEQDKQLAEWAMGIERLIGQITSMGQAPVWRPKT